MPYVLDIALVLILAVGVFIGVKRGCAKMLVRVVGTLLAVAVAASLSGQLAGGIFDGWLSGLIKTEIAEKLPELSSGNLSQTITEVLDGLPTFVVDFVEQQQVDLEAVAEQVWEQANGNAEQLKETVATSLTEQVVRPISVAVLTVLCFLLLLILLLIAVRLLASVVDKIFKLPLLGSLNKILGGALGMVQGVLWVAVAVMIIQLVAYSGGSEGLINPTVLEKTVLTKHILEINPLSAAIQEVSFQATALFN